MIANKWAGPKVTRLYPLEKEIHKIEPDSNGFRAVEYKVQLTYSEASGRVIRIENFTALNKLPESKK